MDGMIQVVQYFVLLAYLFAKPALGIQLIIATIVIVHNLELRLQAHALV